MALTAHPNRPTNWVNPETALIKNANEEYGGVN